MFLPLAFMVSWASLTASCCASPAPTPSNKVPATTTTVRIIITNPPAVSGANPLSAHGAHDDPNPAPGCSFPVRDKMSEAMLALMLADRDPDPFGGGRHVDVVDLVFAP